MEEIYNTKNVNTQKYIQIVVGLVLYFAMVFSSLVTIEKVYNMLPFYGIEGAIGSNSQSTYVVIKYVGPFIMGGIYYLLYRVYIGMIYNSVGVRMQIFNLKMDKSSLRLKVDPCFIILCVLIGLVEIFFIYFPYLSTLLKVLFKEVCVGVAMTLVYIRLSKELDSMFKPIVFNALTWPILILVILI